MNLRRSWLVGLVFTVLASGGCSKDPDDAVATFNGGEISGQEFMSRYQMYREKTGQRDNILLRKEILNNAINEQLMTQDLREKGFEERPETKERLEQIRLQAMLDRYSRYISVDTLTISEQEFLVEFRAYNSKASARYLYAKSEKEAWDLRRKLDEGATFEELARTVFEDPGLATNGGYLGSFGWGEMEPSLEEVAFRLPVGKISDPFPMRAGYGILKVESRAEQPLASEYDYGKAKEKLRRAILDRRSIEVIKDASHRIATEMDPVFQDGSPELVFSRWADLLATNPNPEKRVPENVLSRLLVSFKGGSWTISDFVVKVQRTTERQRKRVTGIQDVKDVVTGLIVRDELLRRATDAHLENDQQVATQINSASLAFRLKSWRDLVEDTVGISDADERIFREEFESNKSSYAFPPEVNVAEILVRTRAEGEKMMNLLRKGNDFGTLARTYSIRLWAGKKGGELGFGTKGSFGVMGEEFFNAKPGELIGPQLVDPYYGVFKLLERREGRPKTYEEAKDEIVRAHEMQKKQEAFTRGVDALRSRADIHINMEALANIRTVNKARERAL